MLSRRVALAVAAAAALILATFLPNYFDGTQPASAATYAAALSALRDAPNLHIRVFRLNHQSGELELARETWYSRQHGMLKKEFPWPTTKRLYKTDIEWTVFPGSRVAVKRPASQSPEMFFEEFAEKMFLKYADRAEHHPSGDTTIGGVPCRLFVALSGNVTTRPSLSAEEAGKIYLWVDTQGAVRRCENHWFRNGGWQVTSRREVDFGVKIDPMLFGTEFTKTHRIIEPEKVLTEMFDLGQANIVREVNGMILAFHNTVRLPGECLATTVTLRPSERIAKLLRETTDPRLKYTGVLPMQLHLYGARGSPDPPKNTVAEVRDRAMHVLWLIVSPRSPEGRSYDDVRIWFHVIDRSAGKRLSKLAGLEEYTWYEQAFPVASYPKRDFGSLANSYYDQLETLAGFRPARIFMSYGFPDEPISRWPERRYAQDDSGRLGLRVSREGFCDAVLKAWTAGN